MLYSDLYGYGGVRVGLGLYKYRWYRTVINGLLNLVDTEHTRHSLLSLDLKNGSRFLSRNFLKCYSPLRIYL